jgi:KDO2-lipid IV(A) lauroyltransferase
MYSHCGNWELYGGIEFYNYTDTPLPFTEQNFCVVYRQLSSRAWDEVFRDNRFAPLYDRKHFEGYIESKDLVRYVYTHKDEKKVYNVNTDQRPYFASPANLDVDFFGQRVQTMTAAAALARKFGMAVAYLSMRRERRGHYILRYIPICEDASTMDVQQMMQEYYRLLEAEIRQQPENYLWSHKRFKRV